MLFWLVLDHMNKDRSLKLYTNFLTIIQSLGMGKSRLVDETAKLIFTIPFCFRSESDGYPKADIVLRQFFQICANETFELFFDHCLLFFKKLFVAITAEIQQLIDTTETLPCQWHEHLLKNGNRERLYARVVMATKNSLNLDCPRHYPSKCTSTGSQTKADTDKSHRGNTKEPGRSGSKDMLGSVGICSWKTSKVKTSIDHIHGEDLGQDARPVFKAAKALIDVIQKCAKETYPPDNTRPVCLLIYMNESHEMMMDKQMLQDDGRNTYQTMCSSLNELFKLDLFFVFLSTYSNLQEYSLSLHTFWSKHGGLFGRPVTEWFKMASFSLLWTNLQPAQLQMRAMEVQNLMVAGHLQVANVIPVHCEYMISSTPSEHIIAEAAAQVLCGQNMVNLLSQNALENTEIAYKDNQGQLKQLYTSPIPVVTFFCALFPQQYVDKLLHRHTDNTPGGLTFKEAFADTYVMFTHFGKAADNWCMSNTFMFMVLCHNMAISCQEGIEKTTSVILVSIKDKADTMGINCTSVDINKMAFTQDGMTQLFIILILQLGVQAKGTYIPIKIMNAS
ncbi:hypothetical protein PILCRDRAFT_93735 [Piloderma croceum F 1598]|uniref:Uncharacterized protein n=1 Tax=Piloderma croceum (strain F 1598) TaxID=765440 RepID=A0A0C3EV90_PILCF|nr:hypothetical protein PILCRDRAFT_93735 [Piloderma croceum F 1598]